MHYIYKNLRDHYINIILLCIEMSKRVIYCDVVDIFYA